MAELLSRFRWQSLPTDGTGFREAESAYDEAQTLSNLGWQSHPTMDHNLYTKYLEIRRLTLTKHLLYYNTIVLHKFTQHTLSLWLSQHSPFSSTMLIDRWHGKEGILYSQAKADNRVVTCVPHSREFINITRFSNLFITNSRVHHENIFLLPCEEYSRRLPCILPTMHF